MVDSGHQRRMMGCCKQQLLDAYLDSIPASAFIKDLDGRYVYLNQEFKSTFGVTDAEVNNRSFTDIDFYDPITAEQNGKEDAKVVTTGKKVVRNRKNRVDVKFPVMDEEGRVLAVGGFAHEPPTKVVQSPCLPVSNTNLLANPPQQVDMEGLVDTWDTHTYKALFQNMHMSAVYGEVITDEHNQPIDYVILKVNPAYAKLTGLDSRKVIGKRATSVIPGYADDPSDWIGNFGRVAITGEIYRFRRKNCQLVNKWFGGIAYRPEGEERRFVGLFLDVSETVEAQEARREYEERHRNLFESMVQGVVYQDASGSIIAANPSAERILGLTVDQMMGRTSVDSRWRTVNEDGSEFTLETHPAMVALKTGKPVTGVTMGVLHPGNDNYKWIVVDSIPRIKARETVPFQVYSTYTDVTDTKNFERQLLHEKEKAEMADTLKSAFLANMSHEIRTPLNGIIGHIDLALSNNLAPGDQPENLEGLLVARQSGDLLISIIQDILDLSKIEAGQMTINADEVFSMKQLMDQTDSLAHTMIKQRKKTIGFERTFDEHIGGYISGDPFRLQQVLNNLVSNAVKFTDKGKVELCVRLVDCETIEFCVSDTGKGIPKDHLESIFEPFRQVEIGDTQKHGGTGLGLTISRKLVKMMGGELRLASSMEGEKKGSTFTFTFPYKPRTKTVSRPIPPQQVRTSVTSVATAGVERKILVAEDETVSRRLVSRMLKISGYEVILAENGSQAVEQYKQNPDVALILMDVQMPTMDGLEATSVIRQWEGESPERDTVPIIALSAGAMKGDNERGLAVGMTDYLTKPVNFKLLVKTLKKHLGGPESPAAIPIST